MVGYLWSRRLTIYATRTATERGQKASMEKAVSKYGRCALRKRVHTHTPRRLA